MPTKRKPKPKAEAVTISKSRLRKIALYLEYIAFVLKTQAGGKPDRTKGKQ